MQDRKPTQDPFEMYRRLWGPLGLPVPGMAMPTLDAGEVEKRIADLKSVETWLTMNLNMVKLSIQGLEVQRMALVAMSEATAAGGALASGKSLATDAGASVPGGNIGANANTTLWPWTVMQQAIFGAGNSAVPPKSDEDGKP